MPEATKETKETKGTTLVTKEQEPTANQTTEQAGFYESDEEGEVEGQQEKPPEETKPEAPPEYKLKLPDGVQEDAALTDFVSIAKEHRLPEAEAQKLIDLHYKALNDSVEEAIEYHAAQVKEWQQQSMNDKEIGGSNLVASAAAAKLALDRLGTPELMELLDGTGFGNHPEVVRFFARIGKLLSEDELRGAPRKPEVGFLDKLYNKTAAGE